MKRRKTIRRGQACRARALDRRIAELEARQGRVVDWLAETLPGKAAARKLNEKIERLEEEKKALAEERAEIEGRSAEDLGGMTAEAVAGHLAGFGYYFDQFNAGQRKVLVEMVVQAVTVEGPTRARLKIDLPIRPLGKFDQQGSKWCLIWRPQRDEDPNGIPAEFVVALDSGRPSGKGKSRTRIAGGDRKRSKDRAS
jgi:hypothetical protein